MWSFSHTQEAYQNLYHNLEQQDRSLLLDVYAEWRAYRTPEHRGYRICGDFSKTAYKHYHAMAKRILCNDTLVDYIYDRTMQQACCTNGGHEAYICPFMCDMHTLPFDRKEVIFNE